MNLLWWKLGKRKQSAADAVTLATQAANIKTGVTILGTTGTLCADATAVAAEIKVGKTAYGSAGTKLTGTRYFWLEDYAGSAAFLFFTGAANLPASIVFSAPLALSCLSTFRGQSANLTTVDLTVSNSVNTMDTCFLGCTKLVTIILRYTTALVTSFLSCFSGCTALETITGAMSLASATDVTTMFHNCAALVTVTFTANTIPISISFSSSPLLSSASLVSIANGLLEDAAAKTLTMHATSITAMNALMGDITGEDGAYVFTANPAGADTLTHFITDHKVWTIE